MPTYAIYAQTEDEYNYLVEFASNMLSDNLQRRIYIGVPVDTLINDIVQHDIALFKKCPPDLRGKLEQHDVRVISTDDNYDSRLKSSTISDSLSVLQQVESAKKSAGIKLGMREIAKKGKRPNGRPPLGYDRDSITKRLIVNVDEAEIVRKIYSLYTSNERLGMHAIAQYLNEHGYTTKLGRQFSSQTIREVLTNEAYIGILYYADKSIRIENAHEPIIDEAMFRMTGQIIESKQRSSSKRPGERHLLRGLLYCMRCNGRMAKGVRDDGSSQFYCTDCKQVIIENAAHLEESTRLKIRRRLLKYDPHEIEGIIDEQDGIDVVNAYRTVMRAINRLRTMDENSNENQTNAVFRELVERILCDMADNEDGYIVDIRYKFNL